jgi:P4 family phage/plasmid primase-like protien
MNTMASSSYYKDLGEFLSKHNIANNNNTNLNDDKNENEKTVTHTRIPSKELNIYGGKYHIPQEELSVFFKLYYEDIFVRNKKEYLTEKQLSDNGPILVDFDFRYDYAVNERQHSVEHIQDVTQLYLDTLKEFFVFEENKPFPIFVMEKPHVNRDKDKEITKDGIHMIIGIQMDHIMQMMLRDKIMEKIPEIWELPLTNTWDKVLDDGISKGCVNWQMYGSQKPGYECYKLTYYTIATIDRTDNEFMTVPQNVKTFDLSQNLFQLSAQYPNHPKFEINPNILEEYNRRKNSSVRRSSPKSRPNLVLVEEDEDEAIISIQQIKDEATLKKAVEQLLKSLKTTEYFVRETHEYTQILPAKYYEPGSHLLNRLVAFALKHTDERLFLSWVMLRSKACDFDYGTIPSLYAEWKNFTNKHNGVTKRSIMYFARQDVPDEYEKVKKSTIDYYIEETILTTTEFDFAMVLFHMFKDKYVCSSIINKRWYVFKNHRWEFDEGNTLRLAISRDMHSIYQEKTDKCIAALGKCEQGDQNQLKLQSKIKRLSELSIKLKKTNDKNNIMKEAMELFYDREFIKHMDSNKYLLCFTNGVIDFKEKIFRQGFPQDYITKTTGIPYIELDQEKDKNTMDQITTFFQQLFPSQTLNHYMWDHLASCLIGMKKEHAFNIYRGSGSNGKSILTELMSLTLGEYKGTVPITLVTEKRNSIGGTSSEVIQLKGVRYAVMQEPSSEAVINEGVMKELTGGDPIQARALYCDSEIFEPQFSLVVCTNALFEIKSNDDGTWRRLKLVDFVAKFVSEGEQHTDDTKHVFPKDKSLKEKLPKWAPVFASMLVQRAFDTNGEVLDCEEVVEASRKYRQNQDLITGYINERIVKCVGKKLGKQKLHQDFKDWFVGIYGNRKIPKLTQLDEAVMKKFGNPVAPNKNSIAVWHNISVIDENNNEDALDELNE